MPHQATYHRSSEDAEQTLVHAAEYLRASTGLQRYTIENQRDTIRQFAALHGMAVVRSYIDPAQSGLRVHTRKGLVSLLADIKQRLGDYSVVLVYDITRWGRFQDADEGAFLEFLCKRAGVQVLFCAEPFENDGSPMAGIVKSIRRAMAAEYSRNLSIRVWNGQCRLVRLGFKPGGPTGFGLRRLLVDAKRNPKCILGPGERKNLQTDRVILIPGPRHEVEIVWRIFDLYAYDDITMSAIAARLNVELDRPLGSPHWTTKRVQNVLSNPKYAGDNVFNRHCSKLQAPQRPNPEEQWVRCEAAFRALVSRELFNFVQEKMKCRAKVHQIPDMRQKLRDLLFKQGELSADLIRKEPRMAAARTYIERFGSLRNAYASVGYCRLKPFSYAETRKVAARIREKLIEDIIGVFRRAGRSAAWKQDTNQLAVNQEWTLSVHLFRSFKRERVHLMWHVKIDESQCGDKILLARLDGSNEGIRDLHLIPRNRLGLVPDTLTAGARTIRKYQIAGLDALLPQAALE